MKMTTATAVARWFEEIAIHANDPLYLNSEPDGRWSITAGDGIATSMFNDWETMLEADSLEALADLLERDLRLGEER